MPVPEPPQEIIIYNRRSGRTDTEKVYGREWMDVFYGRPWGRRVTAHLLCRHPLSRLFGCLQKAPRSRRKIQGFVEQYGIDLSEAVVPAGGFSSFNDFFIRRLKPEARPIDSSPGTLVSPADSRMQVFQIKKEGRLTIKGTTMTLPQLMGVNRLEAVFDGGMCLVFRLAPSDYHRFGYIEDGIQGPVHTMRGPLHSVSPLALCHKPDINFTNYRQWCFVQSHRLGTLMQVEVGAMMVGSIVQHQPAGGPCRRGQEKGYFQFGGSTVLAILPPGRVQIDADIMHYARKGIETQVRFGERVGTILNR